MTDDGFFALILLLMVAIVVTISAYYAIWGLIYTVECGYPPC